MDLKLMIEQRLQEAFHPSKLLVVDDSDAHRGHVAHSQGARHFAVTIASSQLDSLSRIEAHRKIYALFTDVMPHPLHALKIKIEI